MAFPGTTPETALARSSYRFDLIDLALCPLANTLTASSRILSRDAHVAWSA